MSVLAFMQGRFQDWGDEAVYVLGLVALVALAVWGFVPAWQWIRRKLRHSKVTRNKGAR